MEYDKAKTDEKLKLIQQISGLADGITQKYVESLSETINDPEATDEEKAKAFEEFKKHGVQVRSLTESIDSESSMGRLMLVILSGFAEFERALISERTILGLQRTREAGVILGRPKGSVDKRKASFHRRSRAMRLRPHTPVLMPWTG